MPARRDNRTSSRRWAVLSRRGILEEWSANLTVLNGQLLPVTQGNLQMLRSVLAAIFWLIACQRAVMSAQWPGSLS